MASQLRLPDTNTVPNSSRTSHRSQLSSDYSLLELETFFTRWAPNTDSVVVHSGPSCSFATGDSTDCDQDGALIVENESQLPQSSASSVVRISERRSFSPAGLIQPSGSRGRRCHLCSDGIKNTFVFFKPSWPNHYSNTTRERPMLGHIHFN